MNLLHGTTGLMTMKCQCGAAKKHGQTFCSSCFYKLPEQSRKALYKAIGHGYEEAHAEAMRILNPETSA